MKSIVFSVFLFAVIAVVIEQLLPDNKISSTIKPAIFCAIIISIISLFSNLKFSLSGLSLSNEKEVDTHSIWQYACQNCETTLEESMENLCLKNTLSVENIDVVVSIEKEKFVIKKIEIYGTDNVAAKNLISSYYMIPSENISASGE